MPQPRTSRSVPLPLSPQLPARHACRVVDFECVLRGGAIHDGSGGPSYVGDVAFSGDRIAAIGPALEGRGDLEIDIEGLVVAPGFINMMSWAVESLIHDGRSMSDIVQGVTLEVMGEGASMGPLNPSMADRLARHGLTGSPNATRYDVEWRTLTEYLSWLEARGVSPNVASLVGAGTLREYVAGSQERPLAAAELEQMAGLLDDEMRSGAMGLGSALIYPPETAYSTDDLVTLAAVVARHGGLYASHIRSEGFALVSAVEEVITIAERTGVRAEIYHFKAAGRMHWDLLEPAIEAVEAARARGLVITADVYPYDFSGTSLTACFPPWAHDGGPESLRQRLRDPAARARIAVDMHSTGWENTYLDAGPDHIVVSGALTPALSRHRGLPLSRIASDRGTSAEEAAMDLVLLNEGDVFALYFDIDETNLRRVLALPWVSICSDAESLAAEGVVLQEGVHPRAYGAFARVLGRYSRDSALLPLPEAIHRMTGLPARNLRLKGRGLLRPGYHADIAVFDPDRIIDVASPESPHRYAAGMVHVFVNGRQVLRDARHTGSMPGRFLRGPGHAL